MRLSSSSSLRCSNTPTALSTYDELLSRAGPVTTPHEVIVTVVGAANAIERPRGVDRHRLLGDHDLVRVAIGQRKRP